MPTTVPPGRPQRRGEPGADTIADRALYRDLGLSDADYDRIVASLGRRPNWCEVGMVSVMWSEHCSYRSSRRVLGVLPDVGPAVVKGPGGNAGVVDAGDNIRIAFKVESHNHPTALEPHEGAATGVGGIVRDVLATGARPIALLNALRFGPVDGDTKEHARNRHLLAGAVAGIADYGNCIGVPTIGGDTAFATSYSRNPLVNAMCIGMLEGEPAVETAEESGLEVWALGAATGRDGIHGATFASAEDPEHADRSAVQVGDPFTGKLLIDACLELLARGVVRGLQDMGAAGLTSSLAEMAARSGLGVELSFPDIPRREDGMTPYETMLSESQERMIVLADPPAASTIRAVAERHRIGCARIGRVVDEPVMRVREHAAVHAEVPIGLLVDQAPSDEHRAAPPPPRADAPAHRALPDIADDSEARRAALHLIGSSNLCSRNWVFEQYDARVRGTTQTGPGSADAGIIVLPNGTAIAATLDGNGRYCRHDPVRGGQLVVAEAARNLACVGAEPLGATDCLNFSSPTDPRIWRQFTGVVDGMADALVALGIPCVSGNVSLYNHSEGVDVDPTAIVGMVGRVPVAARPVTYGLREGDLLIALGPMDTAVLDAGEYLDLGGFDALSAGVPHIDLALEVRLQNLVRELIRGGSARAAHDVADGGLATALMEMAVEGDCGCEVMVPGIERRADLALFGESASRVIVAAEPERESAIVDAARRRGVPATVIGTAGGAFVVVDVVDTAVSLSVTLDEVRAARNRLTEVMA